MVARDQAERVGALLYRASDAPHAQDPENLALRVVAEVDALLKIAGSQ